MEAGLTWRPGEKADTPQSPPRSGDGGAGRRGKSPGRSPVGCRVSTPGLREPQARHCPQNMLLPSQAPRVTHPCVSPACSYAPPSTHSPLSEHPWPWAAPLTGQTRRGAPQPAGLGPPSCCGRSWPPGARRLEGVTEPHLLPLQGTGSPGHHLVALLSSMRLLSSHWIPGLAGRPHKSLGAGLLPQTCD